MSRLFEVALLLGIIHFAAPMAYYVYMKSCIGRPWYLKLNPDYTPETTVILPTFDEASLIQRRLENLRTQLFPKEKLAVIVVDSGSEDGTAELVDNWAAKNPDLKLTLIREGERRGKAQALNIGLEQASGEVIVTTDADAEWTNGSLARAVAYFSDKHVAAVTGIKEPITIDQPKRGKLEASYRRFYNVVRVAESKIHSTPIFNGELAAFRKALLKKHGLFPTNVGADDSHAATVLALAGFRSIAVPDVVTFELAPHSWSGYLMWKKRRALHLVRHFEMASRKLRKAPLGFKQILMIEILLHVLNPWLLLAAATAFLLSIALDGLSIFSLGVILTVLSIQLPRRTREAFGTWIVEQLILVYACVSSLFSSDLIWPKVEELRNLKQHEIDGAQDH